MVKKHKKILSALMALAMALSLTPAALAAPATATSSVTATTGRGYTVRKDISVSTTLESYGLYIVVQKD